MLSFMSIEEAAAQDVTPNGITIVQTPTDGFFNFKGAGIGHGVGMSQYGARGRADAGHSYQEILDFYFPGTTLQQSPELVPESVDVRIAVHSETVFSPTGVLTVGMDGNFLDTTSNQLTIGRRDGGWYINSSNVDWCGGFCPGTLLTVSFNPDEPVRVANTENGTQWYAYGQFQLTPAVTGARNCGVAALAQYCLVVAGMTMQQYLYGLREMPVRWNAEAVRAQTIASRSYATARLNSRSGSGRPFDLYSTTTDQAYTGWEQEKEAQRHVPWREIVDSTADMVLTYPINDDDPESAHRVIAAFFSTSNGGYTAASEVSFSTALPYLVAREDPFDADLENGVARNDFFEWYRSYSVEDVSRWLADYTRADLDVGQLQEIRVSNPSLSGRIDNALVTLVGSERTLEVRDSDDEPFGYRYYKALLDGCRATPECDPFYSTKISEAGHIPIDVGGDTNPDVDDLYDDLFYDFDQHQLDDDTDDGYVEGLFSDVMVGDPYADAVAWMTRRGITTGTAGTPGSPDATFSPHDSLTRGQFATFAWRFAGEPEPNPDNLVTFDDVESGSYYTTAVLWMASNGITLGCDETSFCPFAELTNAQIAAFLWRFAGEPDGKSAIPFHDAEVGAYYLEALRWVLDWDIWSSPDYTPVDSTTTLLHPHEPMSRGRMAVLIWNLARVPGALR